MGENMNLFAYRIFCGLIYGVLVDTSWENARDRVREYYKDDKKYLEYQNKERELFEEFGDFEYDEPLIEIYDLSERFAEDINYIFPTII